MQKRHVNGFDMTYLELGQGETPLVLIHGSLGDFRTWSSVLGLLSRRHRLIVPSLRHFFPEHWDGVGPGFTIAQHVEDIIAFLDGLGGRCDLLGHSRGGHLAFRVAGRRPDLLRRLILAEPGGDLDPSLAPAASTPPLRAHQVASAERIAAGDVDGGLASFVDAIDGPGTWQRLTQPARQQLRDNARTLLGQVNEQRQPYRRAEAEAIAMPTLFIGGGDSIGRLPAVLRALAAHVPAAEVAIITGSKHWMFDDDPAAFGAAVLDFLAAA
jgi:pimeloyl-ACP methyl ester carboxylesterase